MHSVEMHTRRQSIAGGPGRERTLCHPGEVAPSSPSSGLQRLTAQEPGSSRPSSVSGATLPRTASVCAPRAFGATSASIRVGMSGSMALAAASPREAMTWNCGSPPVRMYPFASATAGVSAQLSGASITTPFSSSSAVAALRISSASSFENAPFTTTSAERSTAT